MSVSIRNFINLWPISGLVFDQSKCICFQVHNSSSGESWNNFLNNYIFFRFSLKALLIMHSLSELQAFIIISCLISVSVNFSTFLVIGKTSPVTYQVLGHLKTCLVLAFGYLLLHDPFDWRNILGILVALIGMVLYSYFCTRESQKKVSEEATQPLQVWACFLNFSNCIIEIRIIFLFYNIVWQTNVWNPLFSFELVSGWGRRIGSSNRCGKWKWGGGNWCCCSKGPWMEVK